MTTPNADDVRHNIHLRMLEKSDTAKDLGDLTAIPLGFAVDVALTLIDQSNQALLNRLEERLQSLTHNLGDDYLNGWELAMKEIHNIIKELRSK